MMIRAFHSADLNALIQIARISFAEEFAARGETPEGFAQQVRMATKGRMIPFKLLAALAGYRWEIFVAEVDGAVVGCGGFIGRKKMELANLMVHPQYRRRGIGQALLERRLQRLSELGYSHATTTILATNQASLGNVRKQDFEVYDQYYILESPLPIVAPKAPPSPGTIRVRPIRRGDKSTFRVLETRISSPLCLEIEGSVEHTYFLPQMERLMNRLTRTKRWVGVLAEEDKPIGFLASATSLNQRTGGISRPVVQDSDLHHLPTLLQHPANWLVQLNKQAVHIAVPDVRQTLITELQEKGWKTTHSWVRMVKRL